MRAPSIAILVSVITIAVSVTAKRVARQVRFVRELEFRYEQVNRGMDTVAVGVTMDQSRFFIWLPEMHQDLSGWWNETRLPPAETARIRSGWCYEAPVFSKTVR